MFRRVRDLALPKLPPDLGSRLRQNGINQRGDDANGLGGRGQYAGLQRNVLGFGAIRGPLPGRIGGQVAVGLRHQEPKGLERIRKIQIVKGRAKRGNGAHGALAQRGLGSGLRARLRHNSAEVFMHHVDYAAHQVSVAVREVAVIALDQSIKRKVAVLAKGDFAQ